MQSNLILRVVSKMLIPFILLFALYVQFHGDYGPGGGFQAGVIFAAGFILYGLIFGADTARKIVPVWLWHSLMAAGLMLYGGVGVVTMFLDGNYLNYSALSHEPTHGQHLGITLIEFGVGTTVASVMITVFFAFSGHGE